MKNRFIFLFCLSFLACEIKEQREQEEIDELNVHWCERNDFPYGCPGMPCLDNRCVVGTCIEDSNQDENMCCLDNECESL